MAKVMAESSTQMQNDLDEWVAQTPRLSARKAKRKWPSPSPSPSPCPTSSPHQVSLRFVEVHEEVLIRRQRSLKLLLLEVLNEHVLLQQMYGLLAIAVMVMVMVMVCFYLRMNQALRHRDTRLVGGLAHRAYLA